MIIRIFPFIRDAEGGDEESTEFFPVVAVLRGVLDHVDSPRHLTSPGFSRGDSDESTGGDDPSTCETIAIGEESKPCFHLFDEWSSVRGGTVEG